MELSHTFFLVTTILGGLLTLSALCIWVERRLLGLWQERFGPNRVGPGGRFRNRQEIGVPAVAHGASVPEAILVDQAVNFFNDPSVARTEGARLGR